MRKEAVLGNRGVGRMPPNRESKLVQMSNSDAVAKLEQSAEAAYQAMYDAKPLRVKDCYEDAQLYFHRAIEAARLAALPSEVERLIRRSKHMEDVYNSQFRGVGV